MPYHKKPQVIIILSGKRKCGKDYLANKLYKDAIPLNKITKLSPMINKIWLGKDISKIIHLSGPLKYDYAKENRISYDKLLDSSPFKEEYRSAMISYGKLLRQNDPYVFCRAATAISTCEDVPSWIVSDARYLTDLAYFDQLFFEPPSTLVIKVRLRASDRAREARGWIYTQGIDDIASECELDNVVNWDMVIENDCRDSFESGYDKLLAKVREALC